MAIAQKVIGLTGGIGTGKSAVARILRDHGFPVIDLDQEVRELTESSVAIQKQIQDIFGKRAVIDGRVDKGYVRTQAFAKPALRKKLERLFHPLVWKRFNQKRRLIHSKYIFCEAPLLIESGLHTQCDFTVLVTSYLKQRIERIHLRSGLKPKEIVRIIEAQWSNERKAELAHYIIENNGDLPSLTRSVAEFLRFL